MFYFQPYFWGIPNCNFHDFAAKVSLDLSPDPISRATPFTFTLTGSMDEEYLAVALGPITISPETCAENPLDQLVDQNY